MTSPHKNCVLARLVQIDKLLADAARAGLPCGHVNDHITGRTSCSAAGPLGSTAVIATPRSPAPFSFPGSRRKAQVRGAAFRPRVLGLTSVSLAVIRQLARGEGAVFAFPLCMMSSLTGVQEWWVW